MKIGLIGFSTRNYIPYIEYYENIFKSNNISYECIFWDRFNNDNTKKKSNEYTIHVVCKPGMNKLRKIFPMYKFKMELERIIEKEQYTHLVVLTTVPGVLIWKKLLAGFKNRYILDIRDYSYEKYGWYRKIVEKLIANSYFTAISSNGFKAFLPQSNKIITCHNIGSNFHEEKEVIDLKDKEKITIGFVGGIRYFEENCKLINIFANNPKYQLTYIGRKNLDCDLEGYCKKKGIKNVLFKGEFNNAEKPEIYKQIDFINAIYGNESLEVTTALPNRLYDGILFKKPILASKGTYLGEVVDEYKLGMVVDSDEQNKKFIDKIDSYISNFDEVDFITKCQKFKERILLEQNIFFYHIREFVSNRNLK
ncbi:MAG: glycosyltransferase [Acidaminococcaceae bacterium]|nr:glycosyltransferase [Acidaminococcaceae bacterium]